MAADIFLHVDKERLREALEAVFLEFVGRPMTDETQASLREACHDVLKEHGIPDPRAVGL
jgi:hypothetical protein